MAVVAVAGPRVIEMDRRYLVLWAFSNAHARTGRHILMIVLAMTAMGWLALMVLIVGSCRAAHLGDQTPPEPPSHSLTRP
jgi:hypothetical protein